MQGWTGEEKEAFGEALVRLRNDHGTTQAALGKELGVSRGLIQQWENGLVEPSSRAVFALEACFKLRGGTLSRLRDVALDKPIGID